MPRRHICGLGDDHRDGRETIGAAVTPSTVTTGSAATVQDAVLHATGVAVAATEGASFTGAVATFTDDDPNGTASDYTTTITWGDGNTSAGTITLRWA